MKSVVKFSENKYELNHKGEFCVFYKNVFCQEGVCEGCFIFLKLIKKNAKV
jgi:hypothetical protein